MWAQMGGLLDFAAGPHYHPIRALHRDGVNGHEQDLTVLGRLTRGAQTSLPRRVDPKDLMRPTAIKLLVLLFAGLVIACPFEESGASHSNTSSSPGDGTFCSILHSSIAGPFPLERSASLLPSKEPVAPVPKGYPLWSLAQSVDHPPERSV